MSNIFQLASEYRELDRMLEMAEGEERTAILDKMLDVGIDLETKAENYAFMIRNRQAELAGVEGAIDTFTKRKKSIESHIARLTDDLKNVMAAEKRDEIKGRYLKIRLVNNKGSVVAPDPMKLPPQFRRIVPAVPESIEADKVKLYEILKHGEIIEGATLVPSKRLEIK